MASFFGQMEGNILEIGIVKEFFHIFKLMLRWEIKWNRNLLG